MAVATRLVQRSETGCGIANRTQWRVAEVRRDLGVGLGELKAEFHRELGTAKADLITWMFVFWAPAVLALIGLYIKG